MIIFLQQVPPALGVAKPKGDNTAAVAVKAVVDAFDSGSLQAIGLVVLVAAVIVGVPHVRRSLPASLIAVAVATLVAKVGVARRRPHRLAAVVAAAAVAAAHLGRRRSRT